MAKSNLSAKKNSEKENYKDTYDDTIIDTNNLLEDDEEENHADERWLISYADMMTLLFGLFVMLYSIAIETQGKPEQYFSDLADATRNADNPKKLISETQSQITQLKAQLEAKTNELKISNAETQKKEQQLTSIITENSKHKTTITQLQSEIENNKKNSSTPIANQLESSTVALKAKLTNKDQEINSLKEKLSAVGGSESFMVIVLKWESAKHDLDLKITDPQGQTYFFDKRSFSNKVGKFVIDSRNGPGVEMWETPKVIEGNYKVEFVFYNTYGNPAKAEVSGMIITKKGEFPIPSVQMDFKSQKTKSYNITVNKSGEIILK
jgi:flagellar motor protein MotB